MIFPGRLVPVLLYCVAASTVAGATVGTDPQTTASSPADTASVTSAPLEARFQSLVSDIGARFDDAKFAHAHWGVLIQSFRTGRVWYERNADRLFMPASNEKIPTTAAALESLGPQFRFETVVCTDGRISTPTLEGNLIVFGDGDPTLYSRFFKDPREVFRGCARRLRDMGISRITGDVIGDDNAWDDEHTGYGWSLDNLDSWSAAEYGPLQVNENYVDVTITPPATTTGTVSIATNLPSNYYRIVNHVTVTSGGLSRVRISREVKSNDIVVSGTVAAGSEKIERSPTITNPTLFYVTVLKEVLEQEGVTVAGKPVDCDDIAGWSHKPADFPQLIVHHSPPLGEVAKMLMKRSQNLYAETFAHAMGRYRSGRGSFSEGRKVVQERLKSFGIDPGTYAYMDGSGLTRYNLISPRQLVTILRAMRQSPNWEVWRDTMPIAGVDGTLRSRMKGTRAEGNVRAKTGTISNVRSLSGYVQTAGGEELLFSFIVNAHLRSDRDTETVMDGVLAQIAAYDGRP